jgi:glycosyltransferase involved in cell wall biosynthesis
MPLISVLMPAFNAGPFIDAALESLASQTFPDFEVLAIDDGSSDGTRAILERYARNDPRFRVSSNATNKGYLRTWNDAIAMAEGQFITFLDADDTCHPTRLEKLYNCLIGEKPYDICGSAITLIDGSGAHKGVKLYPTQWNEIRARIYDEERFPFCGSAVMVRRRVYETIGGYREFFDRVGWEDHDWLIRCCERFSAVNLEQPLYGYRDNPDSVTRTVAPNEVRKLVIRSIGADLARQRARFGVDCLMTGDTEKLDDLIEKHERPYRNDPSLIFRVLAARALRNGQWPEWRRYMLAAFSARPLEPRNIKLFAKGVWGKFWRS